MDYLSTDAPSRYGTRPTSSTRHSGYFYFFLGFISTIVLVACSLVAYGYWRSHTYEQEMLEPTEERARADASAPSTDRAEHSIPGLKLYEEPRETFPLHHT